MVRIPLFAWPAEHGHVPCLFGTVDQLARNALAAVVTAEGHIEPDMGHVLVVYDARNLAFQVSKPTTVMMGQNAESA